MKSLNKNPHLSSACRGKREVILPERSVRDKRSGEVYPIAVFSNEIIRSSYNLSVMEHRILKHFVASIGVQEVIDPNALHTLAVEEFAEVWGLRPSDVRADLSASCRSLFLRYIFKGSLNSSFTYARWVHNFSYSAETDTFSIKWSPELIEHISLQREFFTKLDLTELVDFNSSYTFRLYEILTSLRGSNSYKNPKLPVETWMFMLDVPESYKSYKIFKARVLKPCVAELQSKVKRFSHLQFFEYTIGKTRKVGEIEFTGLGIGARYKEGLTPSSE